MGQSDRASRYAPGLGAALLEVKRESVVIPCRRCLMASPGPAGLKTQLSDRVIRRFSN